MSTFATAPLDDIFEIARGGSPRPIDKFITNEPDGVNWIMIGDASASSKYIEKTKKKIKREGVARSRTVYPGDFLLTNSMSFGRPYIMKTTGCIHDGWLVLSPKSDNADPNYFYHLLGSDVIYREFERRAAGATVKNLNIDLVKGVEVPLPPIGDQRRIAAILDQADDLRRLRQTSMGALDDIDQSIFRQMFGDPTSGHGRVALDSIVEFKGGGTPSKRNADFYKGDIPWVSPKDMKSYEITTSIDKITNEAILRSATNLIPEDSVLVVNRSGILKHTLPVAINRRPVAINQDLKALIMSDAVEAEYVAHLIKFMEAIVLGWVRATTADNFPIDKLKKFRVFVPKLSEQRLFANRLEHTRNCTQGMTKSARQLSYLYLSLQQRAFSGEL